jgi:hypothetical protein
MAVKKKVVKTKSDILKKAKGLIKTGRERFDEIDFQPIWKRVKTGLDRAVEAVGKGTEVAADKAMNLASRAGVEYQLFELHRKLEKLLAELGGRAYDLAKRTPAALSDADAEITRMVGKISEMEKKIATLEDEAEMLKKK